MATPGHVIVFICPCRDRLIASISSLLQGFIVDPFFTSAAAFSETNFTSIEIQLIQVIIINLHFVLLIWIMVLFSKIFYKIMLIL